MNINKPHPTLMCEVKSLEYDFKSRTGILYMPPVNCCDMGGCIKLFEAIDPKVSTIRTIAGDRQDTIYFLTASGWEARTTQIVTPKFSFGSIRCQD